MLVSSPAAALHTPLFDNSKSWKVGDQEPSLSLSFHHAMPVVMTNVVDTAIPPCKSDAGDGASLKSLENVSGNLSCRGGDESPSLMASILQELDKKRKAEAAVAEQSQPSPGKKSSLSSPNQEADKTNATSGQQPKHHALKRVSFGSSKGSMVETLIYDDTCPLDSKPADHVDDTGETNLEHRQRHRRSNNVFHKLNSNSLTASECDPTIRPLPEQRIDSYLPKTEVSGGQRGSADSRCGLGTRNANHPQRGFILCPSWCPMGII
ncbi:unnamed protein product [Notodromas monacha]|uniref:Uncharacterized protein n=1 Tax=Notodromas monacha TaxID=399045 RepID=A0A7R9BBR8_9CRUS|nr:unnamed protein product [Notodromas monacha]CAG0912387.1 unnamed protein product [Notodromas monacha]